MQEALRELSTFRTAAPAEGPRLSAPPCSFEVAAAPGEGLSPDVARAAWLGALQREVRRVDSNVNHGLQAGPRASGIRLRDSETGAGAAVPGPHAALATGFVRCTLTIVVYDMASTL